VDNPPKIKITVCEEIQVFRVLVQLLYIMLIIMYNNAMGEYLWVLIMPNV